MTKNEIKVEILRHPEESDWERCKMLALNTVGKQFAGDVTDNWKRKMLKAKHSPIRTLMFTIKLTIPYFVSVHLVRHKIGVEHYIQSQRNDRQSNYDRELAPQNAPVSHIIDVNAEQIMFMSYRRLCGQADATTRYVMTKICQEIIKVNPEFTGLLVPMCEYLHECPEFKECGYYEKLRRAGRPGADRISQTMAPAT